MKKTLTALLALSSSVYAEISQEVILGSYYTLKDAVYSTVDTFNGKTETEIEMLLTGGSAGTTADYINRFSSDKGRTLSINTSDLYQFSGDATAGTELTLLSLQMTTEDSTVGVGDKICASITIDGTTYTAYQTCTNRASGTVATFTYDFSANPVTFKMGDTLTFSIARGGQTDVVPSVPVFQGITGPVADSSMSQWKASVKLTAAYAIPEPTTATLSLLALAGLAARRRRK